MGSGCLVDGLCLRQVGAKGTGQCRPLQKLVEIGGEHAHRLILTAAVDVMSFVDHDKGKLVGQLCRSTGVKLKDSVGVYHETLWHTSMRLALQRGEKWTQANMKLDNDQ